MISRDINALDSKFKIKVIDFLDEVKSKWFDIMIFEGLRTKERQAELYAQGRTKPWKIVTWTLQSNHLTGKAIDIVFKDAKWNPTWNWDYDSLIAIAKKYWIRNLKPRETAHFEDDWSEYISKKEILNLTNSIMKEYSKIARVQIFSTSEDDYKKTITAWDIKDLIEIWITRYIEKNWKFEYRK